MKLLVAKAKILEVDEERAVLSTSLHDTGVYLLPFHLENFASVIRKSPIVILNVLGAFGISQYVMKCHHRSTIIMKRGRATFLLANVRQSPYLPEEIRKRPHPNLQVFTADKGIFTKGSLIDEKDILVSTHVHSYEENVFQINLST